jgi:hypothetical protein
MSTAAAVAALKEASKGLSYESESDAPFTTFTWKGAGDRLSKEEVLRRAHKRPKTPVEEQSVADFFKDLTAPQDWHGDEEKAAVQKYRRLQDAVQKSLADAKVIRVGQRNVAVFIVGKTDEGDAAGLKTTAVET